MKPVEPWQARKVHDTIGPMLNYLFRLKRRMSQTGLLNHPLYAKVSAAHDALHSLSVDLHYTACGKGNGRAPTAMG